MYKGHDRATIVLCDDESAMDEIKGYLDARYVSASEAIWRIFGFSMHDEKLDIQRLEVHLPGENIVAFNDNDNIPQLVNNATNKKTTLTEWFLTNQRNHMANELLYNEFPSRWVWNARNKCWTERKKGEMIGRM